MEIYDRFMSGSEAQKGVLNSPCVDKYGGKCLSKDNSKAVPSDRFGKPRGDKKRKGGNGNNSNDGGPKSKKNNNAKKNDGKKGNKVFHNLNFTNLTFSN